MRLKIKNEEDLLRYITSLSIDEGLKIYINDKVIIITRYDLKFYMKIYNKNNFEKIFNNENELMAFLVKRISFPIQAELY